MKKISSLLYTFEIFVIFGIRPIFEISIDNFEYIAIYTAIFCVIFVENGVFLILIEFEIDQISPRESPKNGRICALSLNWKILVNSEIIFEIFDQIYPTKKKFMSLRQFSNFGNVWIFK